MWHDCQMMMVVVVIVVIQVKVAETSRVVRHLYIKEHNVTDTHSCKPNGRTLLVLNVPPYITEVRDDGRFYRYAFPSPSQH